MANRSCAGSSRRNPALPEASASLPEPEVRRWPHPVGCPDQSAAPDTALYYIRCALSCQTQLLAEIKALLEQMHNGFTSNPAEK